MADNKEEALKATISAISKQFGKGAVSLNQDIFPEIERLSSGSIGLDKALGGGWAFGRVIEIFGPPSSGKTTLATLAMASCQKQGKRVAFIDAEHAFSAEFAQELGLDVSKMIFAQPDNGEQALEIANMLLKSGAVDLIVIDSVTNLVPKAELEGEIGDAHVGRQARLMSQALRIMTGTIQKTNAMVIFINQIRMKIGVMFGNPETTSGGNALQFYASQRVDVRRAEVLKDKEEPIGIQIRAKVIKNKTGRPFKIAEFNFMFNQGIDLYEEVLRLAVTNGLVLKESGNWYSYKEKRLGHGANQVAKFFQENEEVFLEIKNQL